MQLKQQTAGLQNPPLLPLALFSPANSSSTEEGNQGTRMFAGIIQTDVMDRAAGVNDLHEFAVYSRLN